MTDLEFGISVTTDHTTGRILAVYFTIRKGKVHETREFEDGLALADYSKNGELLGIELLGPCRVSIVDKLAEHETATVKRNTKRFMKQGGPPSMVIA